MVLTNNNETFYRNPSDSVRLGKLSSKPVLEDISVVIPTLGRPILEEGLDRILKGSVWPGCLIVVEQGNNPEVADRLRREQVNSGEEIREFTRKCWRHSLKQAVRQWWLKMCQNMRT